MKLTPKESLPAAPGINYTDQEFVRWARKAFPNGAGIIEPILQRMEQMAERTVAPAEADEMCCPACGTELKLGE